MIYSVKNRIKRNGQVFEKGTTIDLSNDEAVILLNAGAVEPTAEAIEVSSTEPVTEEPVEKPKTKKKAK
jgi:hypothetical protein